MNNKEILDLLQCCHLYTRDMSLEQLISEGYERNIALMGVQLGDYLKNKAIRRDINENTTQ